MGANVDQTVANARGGAYNFRIHGSIYHRIGGLLPRTEGDAPTYAQIYVHDTDAELAHRQAIAPHLRVDTLDSLQQQMHVVSPFVQAFKQMAQVVRESGIQENARLLIRAEGTPDPRRYNAPTASEIGVLILDNAQGGNRDIVLHTRSNQLQRINENHRYYDAMHYVLMFPQGDVGWTIDAGDMSVKDWYCYRLMVRPDTKHDLHLFGRLPQQYIVDMYAKMEQGRLNYVRFNQSSLRADLYRGVADAVSLGDNDINAVGRRVILPSSFTGGQRHMQKLYHDSMNIARRLGKPDLFITVTCNPKWSEIQGALLAGQTAADRPDLSARVFHMKFKAIIEDLTKKHVLGKVIGHSHTIEFQKRGLPHAHILLIFAAEDKPRNPVDYDNIVSAELPDPQEHPAAYDTVSKNMIHGPCGTLNPQAPCMVDGRCSKYYPREFRDATVVNSEGYPEYRRQNNGRFVTRQRMNMDNRWVVPHNRYLCAKYDAHINVEVCTTVAAIKYVYKYVYKGNDRAQAMIHIPRSSEMSEGSDQGAQIEMVDEVREYLDTRYCMSLPPRAAGDSLDFPCTKNFPTTSAWLSTYRTSSSSTSMPTTTPWTSWAALMRRR